jgi:arylsulfatase A-like enzyme
MSGRVPGHGAWETNPSFTGQVGLDLSLELMPAMLKKAGYFTAHVGK